MTRQDAFYGRATETRGLVDLLVAERIVLLYAPSGAGKTSLIQAGIVPELEKSHFDVLPIIRVVDPSVGQVATGSRRNRYSLSVKLSLERHENGIDTASATPPVSIEELAVMSFDEYLRLRSVPQEGRRRQVLLFDQFEEILTADPTDTALKEAFFAEVGEALRDRGRWALFAIREDYLGGLEPYLRHVPTELRTTFRLDFLGYEAAIEAITKPALEEHVEFDAAPQLVDNLRQMRVQRPDGRSEDKLGPYVEPVQLQVVCHRLWEEHVKEDTTRLSVGVGAGTSVDDALRAYYSERVQAIAASRRISERVLREWIEKKLISEHGMRGQVLKEPEQTAGLSNDAIEDLVNAFLLRKETRLAAIWFELAHDRLVGPIRSDNAEWLDQHLQPFQRQAELWEKEGRPKHLLLSWSTKSEARRWMVQHSSEVKEVERRFVEESSRTLRRRILVLALVGLVAGWMLWQYKLLRDERDNAYAVALSLRAAANMADHADLALLLAAEAVGHPHKSSEPETTLGAILRTSFPLHTYLHGHRGSVNDVAFALGGSLLASASEDGTIRLWDMRQFRQVAVLPDETNSQTSAVRRLAVAGDGETLIAGRADGVVVVWNLAKKQQTKEITGRFFGPIEALAFQPGRNDVVAILGTGVDKSRGISLLDISTGEVTLLAQVAARDEASSVAFGLGGTTLVWTARRIFRQFDKEQISPRLGVLNLQGTGNSKEGPIEGGWPARLASDANGNIVAYASGTVREGSFTYQGRVLVWRAADLLPSKAIPVPCLKSKQADYHAVAVWRGGDAVAALTADGSRAVISLFAPSDCIDVAAHEPSGFPVAQTGILGGLAFQPVPLDGAAPARATLVVYGKERAIVVLQAGLNGSEPPDPPQDGDAMRELACRIANRPLTPEEIRQYLEIKSGRLEKPRCPGLQAVSN